MSINEQHVVSMMAWKEVQSLPPANAEPSTSRGAVQSGGMTAGTGQAELEAFTEITEQIRAGVACCLKGAPAMYLPLMRSLHPMKRHCPCMQEGQGNEIG